MDDAARSRVVQNRRDRHAARGQVPCLPLVFLLARLCLVAQNRDLSADLVLPVAGRGRADRCDRRAVDRRAAQEVRTSTKAAGQPKPTAYQPNCFSSSVPAPWRRTGGYRLLDLAGASWIPGLVGP